MAQVAQGSSVTVQLAKHTGMWVRSTGSAKVTVSAAFAGTVYKQDQFFVGASQQRIGFYDFAADVVIEATTGVAEYEDNPFTYEALKAEALGDEANSDALDVALAVNGLQSGKVPFSNIQLKGLPNTPGAPAGYGDLVEVISSWNPLPARLQNLVSSGGVGVHLYGNSFASAGTFAYSFCAQSGGRLYLAAMSGVGGFRSDQVLAKLQAEGLHPDAKILLYIEGTNDAGQSITHAQHAANMLAIAKYAIDRGVVPIMCVTAPRDASFITEANANALVDQLIGFKYGIPYYDLFGRWVDVSDGSWLPGAAPDNIHPSQVVYAQSGADLWDSIFNRKPCYLLPRINAGYGLLGNTLNQLDSGADNLPDGWQVLSLTGQTYPAMQDYTYPFRGKRARLSMSQSTNGGTLYRVLSKAGKFNDGDDILITGVLNVEAIANARVNIFVRPQGSGAPDFYLGSFTTVAPDTYLQAKFKVPAGTTDLRLFIRFDADAAGAHSATVGYGCWDFYNITTQSLA